MPTLIISERKGDKGDQGAPGASGRNEYLYGSDGLPRGLAEKLRAGMSGAIGVATDSTGAGSAGSGWVSPLIDLLHAQYSRHRIAVRTVSTTLGDNNELTLSVIDPTQGTTEAQHLYFPSNVAYAAFLSGDNQRALPSGDISLEIEISFEAGALNANGFPVSGLRLLGFRNGGGDGLPTEFGITSTGNLYLAWRKADGTYDNAMASSAQVPSAANGAKVMYRVDLQVSDGAGHYVGRYYYSTNSGLNWTLLTTRTGSAVTTQAAQAGTQYWIGHYGAAPDSKGFRVYQAQIYAGIGTGIGNSTTRAPLLPARIDAWYSPSGGAVNPPTLEGAPTLSITNLAKSGAGIYPLWFLKDGTTDLIPNQHYLLADRQEDYWLLAFGHNETGMTAADGYNRFTQLKTMINSRRPTPAPFIHVSQNPQTDKVLGGKTCMQHNLRQAGMPALAAQQGAACVHAWKAFYDDGRPLDELVRAFSSGSTPDGVHPTNAGYLLWAQTVFAALFPAE